MGSGGLGGEEAYGVVISLNSNRLIVDEAGVFARVLVGEVQRVAGELYTTARLALGEVRVVVACHVRQYQSIVSMSSIDHPAPLSLAWMS